MRYSQELKEAILRRILPPNNESIAKVAREEGLPEQTIRSWQKKTRANETPASAKDNSENGVHRINFLLWLKLPA